MSNSSQITENTQFTNNSQSQVEDSPTLLPRAAWDSQVAYLRVLFRAKKALDRIEQAHKSKR
ncbi:hypothetical protein [Nostoc sp. FACHB-110]|uniref:hypothetical protein n=1 Tax=Nostoc sp. FACHB-110 TaxID=2692834 RepID=UPI001685C037|nr:hypothetical protein [Nostoc sp. FACHB-110]MBD2438065.1 hypothetical protein [Nostoc sp. FACHB-110]